MDNVSLDNSTLAILARILGALFYYSPTSETAKPLLSALVQLDQLAEWKNSKLIHQQCQRLKTEILTADLVYQHSLLFEGQGNLEAPPWGSVYLDSEQLLMGESCEHYHSFLQEHGVQLNTGMNEPEDQFGLMLMALALFLEKNKNGAAKQLINEHLITWAPTYLTKLFQNSVSLFYQALAVIALEYLDMLKSFK